MQSVLRIAALINCTGEFSLVEFSSDSRIQSKILNFSKEDEDLHI